VQRRSWLAVQFVGLPSRALYIIALVAWVAATTATFHPRVEELLARRVWRLRPPSALEAQRLGPAWFAVCAAARVDPNRYRVWIHEGPEATAPVAAGSTVAVTSWATYTLPPRHLEAVLAHELFHALALPRAVSLLLYGASMPARLIAKTIRIGLKHHALSIVIKLVIAFLLTGILGVWWFLGFDYWVAMVLSPLAGPFFVWWAARVTEKLADRATVDLGYGEFLAEVFTGREYDRARSSQTAPRQGLKATQPLDTIRLRDLERHLQSTPASVHQPRAGS
jgi:Zn-dependent protease with chaperone function